MYRAIIADVDGTLIPAGEYPLKPPSKRLTQAVAEAFDKKVFFSLATARSLFSIEPFINNLHLSAPIILDNGAVVHDCLTHTDIERIYLSKNDAQWVLALCKQYPQLHVALVDKGKRIEDATQITAWQITKIVLRHHLLHQTAKIYSRLSKNPHIHVTRSVAQTNPMRESLHITDRTATKESGVKKIAHFIGCKTQQIIGIGDSDNDIGLLRACGLKVAVGNATPKIKALADFIAPSAQNDAVAQVIEKYITRPE